MKIMHKPHLGVAAATILSLVAFAPDQDAWGRIDRGGGGLSGGGARPNISAGGGSRPNVGGGGGGSRPNVSRPSTPNVNRPNLSNVNRPSGGGTNISRPSVGGGGGSLGGVSRPSTPNIQRPSIDRPNIGGVTRPSTPITNRPEIRPPAGGLPTTRPSLPDLGGNRPSLPDRPGIGGGNRPSLPDRPGIGGLPDRPGIGGGNRPSLPGLPDRPSLPDRPGIGGGDRPRPDWPSIGGENRPSLPDRPGIGGGNRPTLPDRPMLPDRPVLPDRPIIGGPHRPSLPDRPIIGGDRPNRPDWPNRPNWPGGDINIGGGNNNNNNNININVPGWGWNNGWGWNRHPWHNGWWNGHWGNNWYRPLPAFFVGWGLGSWSSRPFFNPYFVQTPGSFNYAQPVVVNNFVSAEATANATAEAKNQEGMKLFDEGLAAFRAGQYPQSLTSFDAALQKIPGDPVLHELRALSLFALGKFQPAAAVLNSFLASAPGMDWTTLSSLYGNLEDYTTQVRALETHVEANPNDAAAAFVLAYHYLVMGHEEAAIAMLRRVVKLQPKDAVAQRLLTTLAGPATAAPPTTPGADAPQTDLVGNWVAVAGEAKIELTIAENSQFTWRATSPGQPVAELRGDLTAANDFLILDTESQGSMVGQVRSGGANKFWFVVAGGPPDDTGLAFERKK